MGPAEHPPRRPADTRRAAGVVVTALLVLAVLTVATQRPLVRDSRPPRAPGFRIPINHASSAELQTLPGVGPNLANAIIERRAATPLRSANDLTSVPGVGAITARRIAPWVRFD